MATTADDDDGVDLSVADEQLTAELCRQLALGTDVVPLETVVAETDLSARRVEQLMGRYEQQSGSPVERVEHDGIAWRLRAENDG